MKVKPNKPAVLLLAAAMLLSILSAGAASFTASAEPEQAGQNDQNDAKLNEDIPSLFGESGEIDEPGASDEPSVSDGPGAFDEPGASDTPDKPDEPGVSDTPDKPDESGVSDKSDELGVSDDENIENLDTQPLITSEEDIHPQTKSPSDRSGGVTFETTADYTHNIYANGQPLIIKASNNVYYAELYLDSNRNGIGDPGEEITNLKGTGKVDGGGIFYSDGYGYFLPNSSIYGGAKDGVRQYDTSITLTGQTDSSENCNFWSIFGGNKEGTLTGNTHVTISGGNAGWVYGGGNEGVLNGDTSISMTGGKSIKNLYGGSSSGQINGNTRIHIASGQVNYVFGGNENSGQITGNTELTFDDGTTANGWIYGGGAGYSDSGITEVAGNTNITVNGGTFAKNMYGGGAWRGAKAGGSNITINGGTFGGWIYGGGENMSSVTNRASITIKGGSVPAVCASGAGFDNTRAEVQDAEIHLLGGTVGSCFTHPGGDGKDPAITGDFFLELSGDTFSNTALYMGQQNSSVQLKNVTVALANGTADLLKVLSPVTGKLSVTLNHADIGELALSENVLDQASESILTYTDCGSATGRFGTLVYSSPNFFADRDNPLLTGSKLHQNRFRTIAFHNSYVNYYDDTVVGEDNSPMACAEQLVVDGGALRLIGDMLTNMPQTEFRNNPLLIRSSSYYEGIHFDENPAGSARLQWMNTNGTAIPEQMSDHAIAETPSDTPDDAFAAATPDYALKRDTGSRGSSNGDIIWQGSVWYTEKTELLCTCQVNASSLRETLFALPEGSTSTSFTLKDALIGSGLSSNCPIIGHRGTLPDFTYAVVPEGTTIADASITGDRLTVGKTGTVRIAVTQSLNGKTITYDDYVKILQVPEEDNFRFTKGLAEDISLSFSGDGIELDTGYSYIWDTMEHKYLDSDHYTMTLENGVLHFILKKDYLNQLDLGEYHFQANANVKGDANYTEKRCEHDFKVTIALPTEVNAPVIELSGNRFHYDGTQKRPSVTVKDGDTVIPSGEYTVTYENNLNVGTASVTITDNAGGNYVVNGRTTFEIVNEYHPKNGIDYITTPLKDGWTNVDFVITAADNHLVSAGNTFDSKWVKELTRTEETADDSVSFYVKNLETGEISLMATEHYRLDRVSPTDYDIHFNESSVKKLIHEVSFGLLFGKAIDVRITAEDALSGIGSVSYYLSETALTEEQVRNLTDWADGSRFSLAPEDGKKFIIYAKVSDHAGNLVCFASDGAEFDLTPPTITGVNQNRIYYTTQAVTVADKHPGTVTLNEKVVSGDIILSGNRNETYLLKAVDQAGNETTVTIIMKPIQTIAEPISGLLEASVTSDNQPAVKAIIAELNLLPDSEYMTEQEKSEIQELKANAKALEARITSACAAADTKEIQAVGGISKDTVSLGDKENLEKAKDALETALKEYGGNYTESEKQAIRDSIALIDESLNSIRNAETVIAAVESLPPADDVSPDDTGTEKKAKETKEHFDALTDHEKSLVDITKLEHVLAALTNYQILEGNNSQWEKAADNGLRFKANGPVSKFTGILIDGESVDTEYYSVASGSTIITLKANYLEKLSVGRHSLTVLYLDGETSATFETRKQSSGNKPTDKPSDSDNTQKPSDDSKPSDDKKGKNPSEDNRNNKPSTEENHTFGDRRENHTSDSPLTGDESNYFLWLILLLCSGTACVKFYFQRVHHNS